MLAAIYVSQLQNYGESQLRFIFDIFLNFCYLVTRDLGIKKKLIDKGSEPSGERLCEDICLVLKDGLPKIA